MSSVGSRLICTSTVDWYDASGAADSDADKLALLIGLLPQSVNLYSTYHIRQWRYDYRIRLLWLRIGLRLWLLENPGADDPCGQVDLTP